VRQVNSEQPLRLNAQAVEVCNAQAKWMPQPAARGKVFQFVLDLPHRRFGAQVPAKGSDNLLCLLAGHRLSTLPQGGQTAATWEMSDELVGRSYSAQTISIYLTVAILFLGSIGLVYGYRSYRIFTEPPIIIQKNTFEISNDGTYGHDLWFKNLGETTYSPRMTDYSVSRPSGLESVIGIVSFGDSLPTDAIRHTLIAHINPGDLRDALVICFDYKNRHRTLSQTRLCTHSGH